MSVQYLQASVDGNAARAWDTIWKWTWFTKPRWQDEYRDGVADWCTALEKVLRRYQPGSILESACGLGFKAVVFAELGYEVEGADQSPVAVQAAGEIARENGLELSFFQSSYAQLGSRCTRQYDCVHSDQFDWLPDRDLMLASARGIASVIAPGGFFVFGPAPNQTQADLAASIEEEWRKHERFVVTPPFERDGVRLTEVHVYDKTAEGVLENRLYLIEQDGQMRIETAFQLLLAKWTFDDYIGVLNEAGFREVRSYEEMGLGPDPIVFHVALK
jgi:SAM-dependent methyltransferase